MEKEFRDWMAKNDYKDNTINSYCRALKKSVSKLEDLPTFIKPDLFDYNTFAGFKPIKEDLYKATNFNTIDEKNDNHAFSCSLDRYEEFLQEYEKHTATSPTYWAAGSTFDKNDDKTEAFISGKKWFDGYGANGDNRDAEILKEIKIGDILLLKSSYTKGSDHSISTTKLKAVGVIDAKTSSFSFTVNWKKTIDLPREFEGISYRQTIEKMRDDAMLQYAKKVLQNSTSNTIQETQEVKETDYTEYISLLKNARNMILSGAPGTGKTYIAKEIAKQMGAETEFVQFHPSYDYTDFVEGLRPTDTNGGVICFERKDGVFKQFCKKAYKNFMDSSKSKTELEAEKSLQNKIDNFLNDAIETHKEFLTKTKNVFYVTDYLDTNIQVSIPANEITSTLKLDYNEIYTILENNIGIHNVREIRDFFKRPHNTQQDSYHFTLCNEIRKTQDKTIKDSTTSVTVEEIPLKPFVFIIDEINRGEISKIFGELFFAIDPGYRGEKGRVQTQYQNLIEESDCFKTGFFVPENVYIIGTMNDIDRSVESMDFAFRRRFAWKEIPAHENIDMLNALGDSKLKEHAVNRMTALNNVIFDIETDTGIEGLSAAYHIGAAYFLKLRDYDGDFEKLWIYHLQGLLKEYLRGMPDSDGQLERLKSAYDLSEQVNTYVADTDEI